MVADDHVPWGRLLVPGEHARFLHAADAVFSRAAPMRAVGCAPTLQWMLGRFLKPSECYGDRMSRDAPSWKMPNQRVGWVAQSL